jgi:hypothetical protein
MEAIMKTRNARAAKLAAASLAALAVIAIGSASAGATLTPVYSNIPAKLPGNFASLGYECCQVSEFGGAVGTISAPAGHVWKNPKVTVVLSSWACQEGGAENGTCKTTKGAKFEWPLTFSVYELGPGNTVGAKIAAGSRVFKLPYRPSASTICNALPSPGGWYDRRDEACYHGFAFKVSFPLKLAKLPPQAIVSVAYNTSDYGNEPQRANNPECDTAAYQTAHNGAGCPFDSLNVAVHQPGEEFANTPAVGSYPDLEEVFIASTYSALFCSPGQANGAFGPSGPCWNEEQPVLSVGAHEG